LTRRNCLPASTMPAAHQRSAICPSRQRLTLVQCARQMLIMLTMVSSAGCGPGSGARPGAARSASRPGPRAGRAPRRDGSCPARPRARTARPRRPVRTRPPRPVITNVAAPTIGRPSASCATAQGPPSSVTVRRAGRPGRGDGEGAAPTPASTSYDKYVSKVGRAEARAARSSRAAGQRPWGVTVPSLPSGFEGWRGYGRARWRGGRHG
jgi:hypothetical protein